MKVWSQENNAPRGHTLRLSSDWHNTPRPRFHSPSRSTSRRGMCFFPRGREDSLQSSFHRPTIQTRWAGFTLRDRPRPSCSRRCVSQWAAAAGRETTARGDGREKRAGRGGRAVEPWAESSGGWGLTERPRQHSLLAEDTHRTGTHQAAYTVSSL